MFTFAGCKKFNYFKLRGGLEFCRENDKNRERSKQGTFSKADRAYIQNRSFLGEVWRYLWKSQIALVEEYC